ncbi:MAG: GTP cyclohydrolase I FolE2 [Candidatus Electrothrix sp. AR1]|nr:GTP cyclohydrolase I FolE2 [Candidatus Electrothrix sp. AR1]
MPHDSITTGLLPDIQSMQDSRGIAINKVGIKDLKLPVYVKDQSSIGQHTVADCSMYVNLPSDFKGTHMSRFAEILNADEFEVTLDSLKHTLSEMTALLKARDAYIEMTFSYFIRKSAPISGIKSIMDYKVTLIGELVDKKHSIFIKVVVPITSLCPCSKEIAQYGAHNQRSYVTVTVEIKKFVWFEEIIRIVEKAGSCEVYGVLKRPDEKYVTEMAYENPKFVEDIVRDIAVHLNKENRIVAYEIKSENVESIHNHSALAVITHDKRH